jgi:hypothetical protein
MKVDGTLLDLQSRGFVVVRDVFDTKLLATIEADARRPNPNGKKFIQFAPDDRLLAEAHFTATVLDALGGQPEVRLGELVSRMAARDKTGRMPLPMFCNLTGSATT